MPQLTQVITPEELERRQRTAAMDLTPYVDIIRRVHEEGGVGGTLVLGEDESQRTEKRRMSVAARQEGYDLIWRKAPEGQLRFVLAKDGEPVPGARQRRPKEEAPAVQPQARAGRRRRNAG